MREVLGDNEASSGDDASPDGGSLGPLTVEDVEAYEREFLAGIAQARREIKRRMATSATKTRMYELSFLPFQREYLEAVNDPDLYVVGIYSGNQNGKSFVLAYDLVCESLGYQPHDGRERRVTEYDIALILRDYENHARKFLYQNVLQLVPREYVRVERTQKGSPRIIEVTDPVTGIQGKPIQIFTHDQDSDRLEGGTWQRVSADEPLPRSHWTSLTRGLQKTGGKATMVLTPTSEEWIWRELYQRAANNGGPARTIHFITAPPGANRRSRGGFMDDRNVDRFEESLTPEERECRVYGRYMGLVGRVHKDFDVRVNVMQRTAITDYLARTDHERFLVVDPHDRLPWAMIWAAYCPETDIVYVVDEFPEEDFYSLTSGCYNYDHYAEVIFERGAVDYLIMDPNAGACPSGSSGLTRADEMARRSRPDFPLAFDLTVNDDLQVGHQAVRERLIWNRNQKMDESNRPRLYVADTCRNVITGFENYLWDEYRGRTASGREPKQRPKERYKHFPDVVRYLCVKLQLIQAAGTPRLPKRTPSYVKSKPRTSWSSTYRRGLPSRSAVRASIERYLA